MPSTDTKAILNDALRLVEEAKRRGIPLRLTGGAAVEYHNHTDRLGVPELETNGLKDVDMVTYRSNRVEVNNLFTEAGYIADRYVMAYFGEERFLFHHPENKYTVDLFFENLRFNHTINLRPERAPARIELDYPTLTIADLMLSKLQIHNPEEKDVRDLRVLILEHPLSDVDAPESIDVSRIASVLSDDWGFWFDAKSNLARLERDPTTETNMLVELRDKVEKIISRIDSEPKSRNWEKRKLVGTRKKWWDEVEELVR
ncbi:MAG: hypothetical protein Q8O47_09015 [Candidatus Bathyarchaeota archaeon]|nr:hypothetical protein [Candidatus Bathyarchaeota archaeon]